MSTLKERDFFSYKCVDGKTLETIDYKFEPNYWDGEEVVNSGKFLGIKWKDIYEDTLKWYIENNNGYFKESAVKELKRRG